MEDFSSLYDLTKRPKRNLYEVHNLAKALFSLSTLILFFYPENFYSRKKPFLIIAIRRTLSARVEFNGPSLRARKKHKNITKKKKKKENKKNRLKFEVVNLGASEKNLSPIKFAVQFRN